MKVLIDGVEYVPKETKTVSRETLTATDVFEKYLGTKEYEGIVETIQKWYYGRLVKASWCATSLSWALSQLGIMKYTMNKKEENVKAFCDALKRTGTAKELPISGQFKRGDILIFNWDGGEMSTVSNKHITTVYKDTTGDYSVVKCLGGNQGDAIKVQSYNRSDIYAAFRPDYSKNTVSKL